MVPTEPSARAAPLADFRVRTVHPAPWPVHLEALAEPSGDQLVVIARLAGASLATTRPQGAHGHLAPSLPLRVQLVDRPRELIGGIVHSPSARRRSLCARWAAARLPQLPHFGRSAACSAWRVVPRCGGSSAPVADCRLEELAGLEGQLPSRDCLNAERPARPAASAVTASLESLERRVPAEARGPEPTPQGCIRLQPAARAPTVE